MALIAIVSISGIGLLVGGYAYSKWQQNKAEEERQRKRQTELDEAAEAVGPLLSGMENAPGQLLAALMVAFERLNGSIGQRGENRSSSSQTRILPR